MQDLTTGSVTAHLLKTTSFMLVSMVFQTLYVLVDLYWVGRLGTDAVAAVAISGNLMFLVLAATQMLGVGATTLVSHAAGRKDRERANVVFNQAQGLSIAAGLAFLIHAFARFVTEGAGTPAPVAPTERLVVGGAYRYVRNPMYLAVLSVIVGQALVLGQFHLLTYAAVIAAIMLAFVRGYEEPVLSQKFGAEYDDYRRHVPGWWPRLQNPYRNRS